MRTLLLAVQSIDGCMTRHDTPGTGFASAEDQTLFRETVAGCDCVVMGSTTYAVAREGILARRSPERLRIVLTSQPERWAGDVLPGCLEFRASAPGELVAACRADGRSRLAILGGGSVNRAFLAAGLVDELWLTIEPRVFGAGVRLVDAACDVGFRIGEIRQLSERTLLIRYFREGL